MTPVPSVSRTTPTPVSKPPPASPRPSPERPVKGPEPVRQSPITPANATRKTTPDTLLPSSPPSTSVTSTPATSTSAASAPVTSVPAAATVPEPAAPEPVSLPRSDANHLKNPAPAYPMMSRRLKEQGTVLIELTVLPSGRATDLAIKQSSGFRRLDEAAMNAVREWQFEPARRGGTPIAWRYLQPISFSLN
jgi:protein TonB